MPPMMKVIFVPFEIFATELVYFLIIFLLCLLIFFKTREIYGLTKHKGIKYFRNAFIFFGIAYFFRFLSLLMVFFIEPPIMMPRYGLRLGYFFITYLGTVAVLSLIYSSLWKRLKDNIWDFAMHAFAIVVAVLTWFFRTPQAVIYVQMLLFGFLLGAGYLTHVERKKKRSMASNLYVIYVLLMIFWIINLFALSEHFINPYLKIPLYILSTVIFGVIAYRVNKRLSDGSKKR